MNNEIDGDEKKIDFSMLFAIGIVLYIFFYIGEMIYTKFDVVDKRVVMYEGSWYKNHVQTSDELKKISTDLTQDCQSELCTAQALLNYVTAIPYIVNHGDASKPLKVIKQNYGDCDDKSNLYGSLLQTQNLPFYFVFSPRHVFVVVNLPMENLNGKYSTHMLIEGRKYYFAETTATNFPLGGFNKVNEFEGIYDPVKNEKINMDNIRFVR